ncbi:MAG: hypothetical protein ACRDF7_05905 [Candidatus Limnocylindrales bacterium]
MNASHVERFRWRAIVLAVLFLGCQPASGGPQLSLGPAASPPAFDQLRWSQASINVGQYEGIADVAATAVGWVAGGYGLNLPYVTQMPTPGKDPMADFTSAIIWTSADGLEWSRVPDGPEFDGARISDVVGHGNVALAFGIGGVCLPDACSGLPPNGGTIVWSSDDGKRWQRLEKTGLEDGAVTRVIDTGGGLIAVGYVANQGSKPDGDPFSDPTDAAVWRSADGRLWERVPGLPVADDLRFLYGVGRRLLAMGSRSSASVAWTSADAGATWIEATGAAESCCQTAAALREQVIVVSDAGQSGTSNGYVSSTDLSAHTWSTTSPTEMAGYRPVIVRAMGSSFVVFGFRVHADLDLGTVDDAPATFSSLDGANWTAANLPATWGSRGPIAVGESGRQMVAILMSLDTFSAPGADLTPTIWFGTADK